MGSKYYLPLKINIFVLKNIPKFKVPAIPKTEDRVNQQFLRELRQVTEILPGTPWPILHAQYPANYSTLLAPKTKEAWGGGGGKVGGGAAGGSSYKLGGAVPKCDTPREGNL